MVWTLKGPARGPDGDHVAADERVPDTWPSWFIEDLKTFGQIEDRPEEPDDEEATTAGEQVLLEGVSHRDREFT